MSNAPSPDITMLLGQLADSKNPNKQLLAQLLEKRFTERQHHDDRAAQKRTKTQRALALMRRRNEELAAACGACVCWGQPACPVCGGRGGPGWQMPDESMFLAYVEPALRRLGLVRDEAPRDECDDTPGPATTE